MRRIEMAGKPKPTFFVLLALVVLGLVGYSLYRMGILAPEGKEGDGEKAAISKEEFDKIKSSGGGKGVEAPDQHAPTTVKEYSYVAAATLPPVKGVSSYSPLKDQTVRFALNVWAG